MFERLQERRVIRCGFTRVQDPVLVLAGELQYRFEFSQRMTPPQLLMNVLSEMAKVWP